MMFWSNPERYRLREIWKLAPIEPKSDSFAALLTFGRRRGTCFHELLDAAYRGVPENEAIQSLKDGGFGEREINVARQMAERVRELYPSEKYLAHESLFECDIPGSPHKLLGRIDHILERDGETIVGDWKSSKPRSKRDIASKADEYCKSVQVGFYLLGARQLGFDCQRFLYRLVQSGTETARVQVTEHWTQRTSLELKGLLRSVAQTCDLIEWMTNKFGTQLAWPQVPEKFSTGYEAIAGKPCYHNYIPDGFTEKKEHLENMKEAA